MQPEAQNFLLMLVNLQAYLLEGLVRWNTARALESIDAERSSLRSFDAGLQDRVNRLSIEITGQPICTSYRPPSVYTGELVGVAYLLQQTGERLPSDDDQLDQQIDAGFEEEVSEDPAELAEASMASCADTEPVPPAEVDSDATEPYDSDSDSDSDSAMDEQVQCHFL